MEIMQESITGNGSTKVIQIRMPAQEVDRFLRLSREVHGRSGQEQGKRIVREWMQEQSTPSRELAA